MTPEKIHDLAAKILSGQRWALAKAITLIENLRADMRPHANQLVSSLLPHTGKALRIGVSGVPGAGKSTFIEALGLELIKKGHKVAVLAVDPSSKISGGSILGDKVRMEGLSREANAFIRPSPSSGSLGGVTRRTRETMLLCEAGGYDVVLIETVGVGQSEVTVSEMVDFFLVLMLPGAGDEIQGIKKGIIEMADALVVNKADGDMQKAADRAAHHYRNALHLLRPKSPGWSPPVQKASALTGLGIGKVWETILKHRSWLEEDYRLERLREKQMRMWFHAALEQDLLDRLYGDPAVAERIPLLDGQMARREKSPHQAAEEIISLFLESYPG